MGCKLALFYTIGLTLDIENNKVNIKIKSWKFFENKNKWWFLFFKEIKINITFILDQTKFLSALLWMMSYMKLYLNILWYYRKDKIKNAFSNPWNIMKRRKFSRNKKNLSIIYFCNLCWCFDVVLCK